MTLIVPRRAPTKWPSQDHRTGLEQIFTEPTPIQWPASRIVNTEGKEMAMTLSNSPLAAGSGWIGWVVVALVIAALWAVPIAATFALFPTHHHRGRRGPSDD
jgi:hypothetical protein